MLVKENYCSYTQRLNRYHNVLKVFNILSDLMNFLHKHQHWN